jgi:hypothetical protein
VETFHLSYTFSAHWNILKELLSRIILALQDCRQSDNSGCQFSTCNSVKGTLYINTARLAVSQKMKNPSSMASTTLAQQNVQDFAIESDIAPSSPSPRSSIDESPSFVYLHATCRKCHHWYNKHKIPSSFPKSQTFELECPMCHTKLFRVGTQSSQDSFMTQDTDVPESRPPSVDLNAVERLLSYESSQLPPRIRRPGLILDTSSTQSSHVGLPGSRPPIVNLSATERILSGESSDVPTPIHHSELILDTSTLQSEQALQPDSETSKPRTPEDLNNVERSNDTLATSASGTNIL